MKGKALLTALILIVPAMLSLVRLSPRYQASPPKPTATPLAIAFPSLPSARTIDQYWRIRAKQSVFTEQRGAVGDIYQALTSRLGAPYCIVVILESSPQYLTSPNPITWPSIGEATVNDWTPRVNALEIINQGRSGPAIWTIFTYWTITALRPKEAARDPLLEPPAREALQQGATLARAIQVISPYHNHYLDILCEYVGDQAQPWQAIRLIAHL